MKTINRVTLLVFVAGSLILARTGDNRVKATKSIDKVKNNHYFDKNVSEDSGIKVDRRKRSHKRRRKIRKPIKGLR